MITRVGLSNWIVEALKFYGGSASIVEICKYVWENYAEQLRESGDLFYTWQYEIRWAAGTLRKQGIMKPVEISPQGIWELL
ncbi:hypothetical protein [Sporomusa sp. GT1]|uniref:hypothetical protein n=1 Tax=Sporomusa sp. GT1 TaxID=1534747 RepID=UPI00166DF8BA|nr:hypothetical protein [Sporomusa sp. GT1]